MPKLAEAVKVIEGQAVHYVAPLEELPCRAAMVTRVVRQRGERIPSGQDEDGETIFKQKWIEPENGQADVAVFLTPGDAGFFIGMPINTTVTIKLAHHDATGANGTWHRPEECPHV